MLDSGLSEARTFQKRMRVETLIRILERLPAGRCIDAIPNQVGNLSIRDEAGRYLGYVCFATEKFEEGGS